MGGLGSGRSGGKPLVENACAIDVRSWAREGYFNKARLKRTWEWRSGRRAVLYLSVDDGAVSLLHNESGELTRHKCWLRYGASGFGGQRLWAICPMCSNDVGVIYIHMGQIGCRQCLGLRYTSQRLSKSDRRIRLFHRLWRQLRELDSGRRFNERHRELATKLASVGEAAFGDYGRKLDRLRGSLQVGHKAGMERSQNARTRAT
jgi:hypothetical protein